MRDCCNNEHLQFVLILIVGKNQKFEYRIWTIFLKNKVLCYIQNEEEAVLYTLYSTTFERQNCIRMKCSLEKEKIVGVRNRE